MGFLRVLLALSVLLYHSGGIFGYTILDRNFAVLSFFVISGFYMALILDKKYKGKNHIFLFFTNRILRIYPLYIIGLVALLFFSLTKFILNIGDSDNLFVHYIMNSHHSSSFTFYSSMVNFVLRNITLIVTTDYFIKPDKTPGYLLVQQAWTLQIEMLFYILAPFVMMISKRFLMVTLGLFVLILYTFILPQHVVPEYSLFYEFLTYILYFFLGILSYNYLYTRIKGRQISRPINAFISILLIIYILFYNIIPFKLELYVFNIPDIIYFGSLTFSLPFLFSLSNGYSIDKFLGLISYPMYIYHFLVIKLITNIHILKTGITYTVIIILVTLTVSWLAVEYIEIPINNYRQARLKEKSTIQEKGKL